MLHLSGIRLFCRRSISHPAKQYRRLLSSSTVTSITPHEQPSQPPTEHESPSNGQQPFASIKSAISPGTFKAITVRPYCFSHMTDVQQAVLGMLPNLALPYTIAQRQRDIMVRARTGTGKTLSFLVPAIEARLKMLQVAGQQALKDNGLVNDTALEIRAKRVFAREQVGTLILTPTRELATQIANEALNLTKHHPDLRVHVWIGASSKRIQMRDFMTNTRDIVVATPGRLRDLLENEPDVKKALSHTHQIIFDEADTMLEIGFRDDIEAIMTHLPPTPQRQTFLFSATLLPKVREIAKKHLAVGHTYIDCIKEQDSPVHADIPQYHTVVPSASQQIPHVLRLISHDQLVNPGSSKVMIFLPTTKMTQLFTTILKHIGKSVLPAGRKTNVLEIHSKRPQHSRTRASDEFRNDKSGASVLVSSDVSARGVDYPGVTRIIQVGIPASREQYIHRVGRTGRGSRTVKGRGDFVLLPWEVGFVSWQLTDIPIKPITVAELKSQLSTLAEKHDESPDSYFPPLKTLKRSSFPTAAVTKFQTPYKPLLDEFDRLSAEVGSCLDAEAVRETFLSLIGYYFSKSSELRVSNNVILEGCRQWTTDALAQETPPYVSQMFLQRLGLEDNRTKHFERGAKFAPVRRNNAPSWSGRGAQKNKNREWTSGEYKTIVHDKGADDHRSARYGGDSSRRRRSATSF